MRLGETPVLVLLQAPRQYTGVAFSQCRLLLGK